MRREVFFACIAATTACSVLVDLSGLAGSTASDAGSLDLHDAARDDATEESSIGEHDAGGDVPTARPCDTPHAFCDDFDAFDAAPFVRWESVSSGAGSAGLDPVIRVTAPNAMRLELTPGSGFRASVLSKTVAVTNRKATVSFDLRMDYPDGGFGEVDPVFVRLNPPPPGTNSALLAVAIYGGNAQLEYFRERSDGGNANSATRYPRPESRFQHYVIGIAPSGSSLVSTITIDGALVARETLETADLNEIVVQAGAPFSYDIGAGPTVRIDNFVVDTGP